MVFGFTNTGTFALCAALGLWQLQRFDWKQGQLARIAAMQAAPAQPIIPVLAQAARGKDVSFDRVFADCAAGSSAAGYRVSVICRADPGNDAYPARVHAYRAPADATNKVGFLREYGEQRVDNILCNVRIPIFVSD